MSVVYSDVLHKQKDLFLDDVREDCLRILPNMKQSAHAYLLKPLHKILKVSLLHISRIFFSYPFCVTFWGII